MTHFCNFMMAQKTELPGYTREARRILEKSRQTSRQKKPSILVILRRTYLNITGNHCAAKLIEYFHHWRKWKIKNHRTDWVYMPLKQIYEDLMREHSVNAIRGAIANLIKSGFLKQRHNPRNGQDRTYQYQLQTEHLEFKLTESGSSISEIPSVSFDKTSTQDPPKISKPQQHEKNVVAPSIESKHQEPIQSCPVCPEPPVKQIKSQPTLETNQTIISTERINEVEALLVDEVSPALSKEIQLATPEVFEDAIALLRREIAKKTVKNPCGFLMDALRKKYKPSESEKIKDRDARFTAWRKYTFANDAAARFSFKEGNRIMISVDGKTWIEWQEKLFEPLTSI